MKNNIHNGAAELEAGGKSIYFKIDLDLTMSGGGFLCRCEAEEAINNLLGSVTTFNTPTNWKTGFAGGRPVALKFGVGVQAYAAVPETEAKNVTDAAVGERVTAAFREFFSTGWKSASGLTDEVKELIEGFDEITVRQVERAEQPGEDWFEGLGFDPDRGGLFEAE